MSRELRLRIISAIVMAAVILAATWYGGILFRIVAGLLAILIYYEWATITRMSETNSTGNAWGWFAVAVIAGNTIFGEPSLDLPLLSGFTLTAALFPVLRGRNWWLVGGIVYAGLSGISLAAIRGDELTGFVAILFIFAVVWSTDILAYFVGRAIGGPKLAPSISPGKTWSGAIGGAVAALIGGGAVSLAYHGRISLLLLGLALILSVFSQIGDLFESFVKRRFQVKDSSHLIPGHGGFMDRVDGLVFACFTVFLIAFVHAAATGDVPGSGGGLLPGF
ncbi:MULTISPECIES: phosphatidate cytidylyltransferase [Rhizobium/Agrobacterium group]|jgi:phosphatidate cytidylyltransferase|uniref:Phosphatidate cytidylyltransferase n=2 Tax=Rhizobium/Agrobacterium group TaxID=227290 RepID=A0AA86FTX4_AGRTU|nr:MULTISPECIES: phosphatidate cytidylyltransferase [Rhizobium/Agrobacterium group]AHK01248.1 phosphatidate cytidylyltransferase [Agrobacterium tumefaciens LBA4213 (Ach5)]AKC07056.1 phosphatidate cytidylyltransferase [Agrobacterium tumefaciens]EHJ99714.1 phosphatidate cytidylyltransferase [Agrobacterium tumefaciens 5A]MDP9558905.1 phosphatidate cytidylyltransferase [Rhizobium nepotum]QDG92951.1 phosphatidate cytidylyltransferase [Rhizobium sp. NIBRBAC000502774]HCV71394.1 phosphatidate cytidyl